MSNKLDKYFASIYLAAIGDKIGFGDGRREMNYSKGPIVVENENKVMDYGENLNYYLLLVFIADGGITGLNIDNLMISDDTEMHLGTIKGLLSDYKNRDELYNEVTKYYLESFKNLEYMRDKLLAGRQTLEAIKNINAGVNWKNFQYNKNAGGSGGPMRTMCIGLAFYKTSDLLKLIESTIMITSITHPNCTAFLGAITSALFTSYAIRDMNPEIWIFELKNLLNLTTIDDIIEKIKPSYIEAFKEDKKAFIFKLDTYIETSFDDNYNYIVNELHLRSIYPWKRMMYYYENFSTNKKIFFPGSGADDSVIIAYDCLLMSKNNYEKLIFTSMINIGDSDTVGSIASAWYGALNGFTKIPNNIISKTDPYYEIFDVMSKSLFNKYYEKNIKDF